MKNSFPKTLFQTRNPEFEVSETYEISIEPVPGVSDLHECWIVREMYGYFDAATKTFRHVVETLHPIGDRRFFTCAEAINQANERVLFLAKKGFHFLFVTSYTEPTPPWYECLEVVLPSGEYRPVATAPSVSPPGESIYQTSCS